MVSENIYKRNPIYKWTNFQEDLGYSPYEYPVNKQPTPVREFRAYIEKDCETSATKKESESNLLKKYGGLQFKGDNYGIINTINPSDLE